MCVFSSGHCSFGYRPIRPKLKKIGFGRSLLQTAAYVVLVCAPTVIYVDINSSITIALARRLICLINGIIGPILDALRHLHVPCSYICYMCFGVNRCQLAVSLER